MGTCIVKVPQNNAYIVEKIGKYQKTLNPGFHFLFPPFQKVAFRYNLQENKLPIPFFEAITHDKVPVTIKGILYYNVKDPIKASYNSVDSLYYTEILAKSLIGNELGRMTLEYCLLNKEELGKSLSIKLNEIIEGWGVNCARYEITEISYDDTVRHALNMEIEAQIEKKNIITASEGQLSSRVERAAGVRDALKLLAEAQGEKILLRNKLLAKRIKILKKLLDSPSGELTAKYLLSESFLSSFGNLSEDQKKLLIENNINKPNEILKQALEITNVNLKSKDAFKL